MNLQNHNSEYQVTSHLHLDKDKNDQAQAAVEAARPRIVLSQIESAVAFLPMLAVAEGVDLTSEPPLSAASRIVKRTDLAARMDVDPQNPIGAQLAARGQMSKGEARLVDGEYFEGRPLSLRLRIENTARDAFARLAELKSRRLIEAIDSRKEQDEYLFVQLRTRRFIELAKALTAPGADPVVLLSINDSVLLV